MGTCQFRVGLSGSDGFPKKLYCLTVMPLVAAAYTIALRYTRMSDKELYFSTTAVCITEVIKLLLHVEILAKETGGLGRFKTSLREKCLGESQRTDES